MNTNQSVRVLILSLGALTPVARADDAETDFGELFGARAKRVAATRQTADDTALAKTLLGSADSEGISADLADQSK